MLEAVRRLNLTWTLLVGGALVVGVALRVWILTGPLGMAESDEAIVGLMAEDALDGTFHVFYWVNYYSGTQEVLLTAALFALVGSSVVALKVVPAVLIGLACLVTWRIGRLTVGEPAARIGAALMWVWPPFLVFWSTKARSAYGVGLLCAAVVLWMAVRLRERPSRLDAAVLGFALGCGIWSTQQSLLMALPAVAWLIWRSPGVLRLSHYAVAGGLVGGAPWIAWNLTHGLKGVLPVTSVAGQESTYFSRFADLFTIVLPEWLGLRLAYSKDWLVWAPLGVALTVGRGLAPALRAGAAAARRRASARDRGGLPVPLRRDVVHVLHGRAAVPDLHRARSRRCSWRRSSAVRGSRQARSRSRPPGPCSTSCASRIRGGSAISDSRATWGR